MLIFLDFSQHCKSGYLLNAINPLSYAWDHENKNYRAVIHKYFIIVHYTIAAEIILGFSGIAKILGKVHKMNGLYPRSRVSAYCDMMMGVEIHGVSSESLQNLYPNLEKLKKSQTKQFDWNTTISKYRLMAKKSCFQY